MRSIDLTQSAHLDDPRFSGKVLGAELAPAEDPGLRAFLVSFEPEARTAWHSHPNGQLLICTEGHGVVSRRDGEVFELRPGNAVWTDPGEEHWHGACAEETMSHLAVQTRPRTPVGESSDEVQWLELVDSDSVRRAYREVQQNDQNSPREHSEDRPC